MGCLLCLNVFTSITADFNISSTIRWAIQDQWSSGLKVFISLQVLVICIFVWNMMSIIYFRRTWFGLKIYKSRSGWCKSGCLQSGTQWLACWPCSPRVTGSILSFSSLLDEMSLVTRKPVFGVCDQVRLKPACSATEATVQVKKNRYFLSMINCLFPGRNSIFLGEIVENFSRKSNIFSRKYLIF